MCEDPVRDGPSSSKDLVQLDQTAKRIKSKVYVGGRIDGIACRVSNKRKFTHVLCLEQDTKYPDPEAKYEFMHAPLKDNGTTNLERFVKTIEPFVVAGSTNGKLLIHCSLGCNRAPTIATWYLIKFRKMTFEEAFDLVRSRRQGVNIHPKYEAFLRKVASNYSPMGKKKLAQRVRQKRI